MSDMEERKRAVRILIIRNYPNTFLLEKQSYNIQELGLAKALMQKGHQCDVAFWTKGEDRQVQVPAGNGKQVTVYYVHGKNILKNGVFSKRLDVLASAYDMVQISEYNQYQAWKFAKKFKDKMVLLHGPYYAAFNKRYNLMCRIVDLFFLRRYKKLNTQFMVKSALAEQFLRGKGIRPERIERVYVGIDRAALCTPETRQLPEFVQRVQADPAKILLYVGRLEPRRQSLFLLETFRNVLDAEPRAKLVVVGDGDESYKALFRARMRELGLTDHVAWLERLEQKYISCLYERAKVFLLPTEFEIFGMVLLEAMYFSSVAVTTYNGGSVTLIQDGKNGVCLHGFDTEEWAAKILELLRDEERRREMGKAAHQTIADGFLWDTVSERYLRCYRKKLEDDTNG